MIDQSQRILDTNWPTKSHDHTKHDREKNRN